MKIILIPSEKKCPSCKNQLMEIASIGRQYFGLSLPNLGEEIQIASPLGTPHKDWSHKYFSIADETPDPSELYRKMKKSFQENPNLHDMFPYSKRNMHRHESDIEKNHTNGKVSEYEVQSSKKRHEDIMEYLDDSKKSPKEFKVICEINEEESLGDTIVVDIMASPLVCIHCIK